MNWTTTHYRPTFWSTLREMAAVCLAIWRDYRDCARADRRSARRRRRSARDFCTPTDSRRWHIDWAAVGVLAFVVTLVLIVALTSDRLIPFKVLP